MRKNLFRGRAKRVVAATLAGLMLNMSVLPYLPGNITAHAFGLAFVNSGKPGSPYLKGRVEGEREDSWFLCLNHGAAANSQMDYSRINADISYANGTLEQKKLFWAYIGAFGSYDGDRSIEDRGYPGSISKDAARNVAWKVSENAWVNKKIDEFAMLDNVPEGAKSAKEVLDTVMVHKTPETAVWIGELLAEPGLISKEKLYEKAGVKSWEYFKQYCEFNPIPYEYGGKTWKPMVTEGEYTMYINVVDENGLSPAVGEIKNHPPAIVEVIYDPSIFKVLEVSGYIEYYKARKSDGSPWPGAQQLCRVKGHVEETNPVFYISSKSTGFKPDSGGGGGHLDDGDGIEVEIFRHEETFESNYHVDLTKRDYETGHPLQNATWQVLEAFPDQTKLSSSEEDGELVEDNMREAPTTWDNWLIFQDDMKTNEDGYIKHSDKRFYDFNQTYCNGHPEPPEPDPPAGDDPESQADYDAAMAEYEALMAEWQAAVDECEGIAESSNGTHHHWVKGGTTAGSEAESFESSGCKAVRDKAYENFINLRYSYTFREVEARNGYIIHGQNGHSDDVPIEIITTASSEAGKPYEWTQCSNEDIIVEGYARDYLSGDSDEGEDGGDGEDETGIAETLINSISGQRMVKRAASGSNATDSIAESRNPYLPEKYDLSFGEKAIRALRQFIGLPTEDSELTIHVVAEYDEVYDPELEEELRKEEALEEELENDLDADLDNNETLDKEDSSDSGDATDIATSSNAGKNGKAEISVKKRSLLKASLPHSSGESSDKASDGKDIPVATPSEPQKDGEISDESTLNKKPKTVQGFRKAPSTDAGDEEPLLSSGRSGGYIDLDSATTDSQPEVEPGKSDTMLHSWIVYDHRVPGQIHINKKDMELAEGENDAYSAYGDTQGDATLEGAVYGLFAADPIYGPDTQRNEDGTVKKGTGLLFDANDLVAVAATDKNGDASFLTITEKPHSIYNYETGQIEYTGKPYPKNLYDLDGYRKEYENEETGRIYKNNYETNGDHWIGRPLILGNYYIKELTRSEGYELSITGKDMEFTNATEENRGDYGSTEDSKSHPVGTAWIEQKLSHAVTFPEANPQYGNRENLLSVEIRSNGTTNGFDVVFDGIPEGADFYFDNVKTSNVTVQVPVGGQWVDATEEPLYETAKDGTVSKRDKDGNQILNPDAVKDFPVIYNGYGYEAKTVTGDSAEPEDKASYGAAFTSDDANFRYVKYELEQMLRQIGVTTPYDEGSYSRPDFPVYDEPVDGAYGMPEFTITVNNVTTNKSLIDAVLDYFASKEVYTYGSLQDVALNGNTATVRVAVGMNPKKTLLYKKNAAGDVTNAYLFKLNEVTGRYVMREYSGDGIIATELPGNSGKYQLGLRPDFAINENGMPENVYTYRPGTEFLKYQTGDIIYDYWYQDAGGNWVGHEPVRRRVYQTIYEEQVVEQTDVSSSKVAVVGSREEVKDPVGSTYVYYDEVSKQYILHAGAKDAELSGEKTSGFTIALPNGTRTLTDADIEKIGSNNVWGYKVGQKVQLSEYLVRIQGAGAGVHTAPDFDKDTSYIKNQRLIYNGNHNLSEDGNTDQAPNPVKERIITEEIKVTKTIQGSSYNNTNSYGDVHEDWFTETFGGLLGRKEEALKMDNFRFKTYLKSNLEGLYRDNDGNVVWLDRTGKEVDQLKVNANFPALVNKIYTKVPHKTAPLYKDSDDAIIANAALYSYKDGLINENQNAGYTAVLETITMEMEDGAKTRTIEALNYDKFFDAIAAANNDKWDDAAPTYTSWKPIGNQANRNENAIENARVSDMVRQFAIDWYLDDEIKKLVRPVPENNAETEDADGKVDYSDELYDEALRAAIIKAENYLKPFFAYDLDEIYAVAWDSEEGGGKDKDLTTLSADTLHGEEDNASEGYYYGTSLRLPYGTYVVVEQQPRYANLEDFKNRHYQIDKPKEVSLPSVYADYEGSQQSPEVANDYYNYSSTLSQPEMERRYKIRFNEEALHVIKGRNSHGDFEVYKYGMDMDRIRNGVTGTGKGDYFALTQSEFKPYKNYYNLQDDRTTGDVPYYLTEGLSGREKVSKYYRYSSVAENKGTADNVPFPKGTVTEDNQPGREFKDQVVTMQGAAIAYEGKYAPMLVPWSIVAPENAATEEKETQVQATGESSYKGYAYTKLRNRFFTSKLRIEKLDSETHENILHDGAIFNIYAAKRDDSVNGEGKVLFYEEDTTIHGTKEFLAAMGATDIRPMQRRMGWFDRITGKENAAGNLYTGVVPAGTPVCEESEQIYLGDEKGNQTVAMKSYTTVRDGLMKDENSNTAHAYQNQTVGYLETPQPLGAGAYVIAEVKPPTGYTRSKPIALEVYSDRVTYYKEGNKDERVVAAIYEYPSDDQTANANKPQDAVNVASVNVENYPIKLQNKKLKETGTVTFKVGERIEGSLTEIGGNPNLEYAYENGVYLGYAWRKGTLEKLAEFKAAGDKVELVYIGNTFAGYGYVTRTLETDDDANPYVVGATMTLFDALELSPSGDSEDKAYEGLVIERNNTNNIGRMYVKQGFAGEKVEFVEERDENGDLYEVKYPVGVNDKEEVVEAEGHIWRAETIQRPDTDILYYDLDGLTLTFTEKVDGKEVLYGYDKNHKKVNIEQLESDKANFDKTDSAISIFAFKGGSPYLEFVGGDFTKLKYDSRNKIIEGEFAELKRDLNGNYTFGEGTVVYHLDRNGDRDSRVDPYTGMAYVVERVEGIGGNPMDRILVWPVNIARNASGNIISRDKITTSRLATVGEEQGYVEDETVDVTNNSGKPIPDAQKPSYEHTETGRITGTWRSDNGEESHSETTVNTNKGGQNMNEDVLVNDNNGRFDKDRNPVFDEHGLIEYYQRSDETYDKGTELYDRNGDFVRYKDSDNLEEYNNAAYKIDSHEDLYDGEWNKESQVQDNLYHRLGEGYILENTWVTSDKTPNDPFHTEEMEGQPDILKRVPAGHYIMEELVVPEGYSKGMPTGITVNETAALQEVSMYDNTTKIWIEKLDGVLDQEVDVVDMDQKTRSGEPQKVGTSIEPKSSYSFGQVEGAVIALYPAKRVYTSDFEAHPNGYYFEKASEEPLTFETTDSRAGTILKETAKYTTEKTPLYIEAVPAGDYLLCELSAPDGMVTAEPVEIIVTDEKEVQLNTMYDDHTKVEIEKYVMDGSEKELLNGAGFTLYEADVDADGNVKYDAEGNPLYLDNRVVDSFVTDDATDYTETINLKDYPNTSGENKLSGFITEFEKMYKENGTKPGTSLSWAVERTATRPSDKSNTWTLEDGSVVVVTDGNITFPDGLDDENRNGFRAAVNEAGNRLTIKWAVNKSATYLSSTQIDASIAGGSQSAFPTTATMLFETEDHKRIEICVYQVSEGRNGREYTFEYRFDLKELPHVNEYAKSYLTANGRRRFDYLPVDGKYVLVETTVPEGYAKAKDLLIEVANTPNVQLHDIRNEQSMLLISKVVAGGTKEMAGNKLALYKADASGNLTQKDEYLVETWVSGEDGVYTDNDFVNGLIPDGYERGDLKPHAIKTLADGIYYLVELETLDYYTLMEPIRFEYTGSDEIKLVRAENAPAKGDLEITKTDENGGKLNGVTFELTAYESGKMGVPVEGFPIMLSDYAGIVRAENLPVGKVNDDGSVTPYIYKLKEQTPPEGYAASTKIISFSFKPTDNGLNYKFGQNAFHEEEVVNEETSFFIEKRFLDSLNPEEIDGAYVTGAVMAVYKLKGTGDNGEFIYSEEDQIDRWTVKEDGRHELKGLIAGQSYVLVELKAPQGVNIMEPVVFSVSADGRHIYNISNKAAVVTANYISMKPNEFDTDNLDTDSIDSITVRGRFATKVMWELVDEAGNSVSTWTAADGEHTLYEKDGLKDGAVYTLNEHTIYSDGDDVITAKETRRIRFKDGKYVIDTRDVERVELLLTDEDGVEINRFSPNEFVLEETIENNAQPENPKVVLKNRNSEDGDPLVPGKAVLSTIAYVNTANARADVTVEAALSDNMELLDAYDGKESGNTVRWVIEDVEPGSGGYVSFLADLKENPGYEATVHASVSVKGKAFETEKVTPIQIPNRLTINNLLTGSGKELYKNEEATYRVRLFSSTGEELRGIYGYEGSKTGSLRSGDTITLGGNEYVTIDPTKIYRNARYEVERIDDGSGKDYSERTMRGIILEDEGAAAVTVRSVKDTSERELFRKGGRYYLTETTVYTDDFSRISNKFVFTLSDKADIDGIGVYDQKTKVSISKTDFTTGEELPGNHMQIIEPETGRVVEDWISGEEPHIIEAELEPGKEYVLHEERPKDGYGYAEDIRFTVNTDGTIDKVVMENKPTEALINKTDITDGKLIAGATLEIQDLDGNVVVPAWKSEESIKSIYGVLVADKTYKLVEKSAPDGFVIAEEVEFTVPHDGGPIKVEMKDDTTKIRIYKNVATTSNATPSDAPHDPDKGEHIKGAVLQILNEDKTPAKAANSFGLFEKGDDLIFTTGDTFTKIVKQLVAGNTYWLHEVRPADGFAYADDVKFTVSENGEWDIVEMTDKPTHVEFSKQKITGNEEMEGVKIGIYEEDGTLVEEWITDGKPHVIIGKLVAGKTYIMREVSTIPGWAYSEEIRFTVSLDGSVDHVVMKDKPTHVEVHKTDGNSDRLLGGAEFKLVDWNGNTVIEKIVTEEGKPFVIKEKLEAGKTYTLIETKTPPGDYIKAPNVTFTVSMDGSVDKIIVRNFKGGSPGGGGEVHTPKLVINKHDGVTFESLPGAIFEIRYSDGRVYAQVETDANGRAVFTMPPTGNYVYEEIKAPEGYLRNPNVYPFSVRNDTPVGVVGVENFRAPEITINKVGTVRLNTIMGAELVVYHEDGTVVATGTTDANGQFKFTPDEAGTYYVLETKAPEGYELNETPIKVYVSERGEVSGNTTLYNDEEQTEKKRGKITAFYDRGNRGGGNAQVGDNGKGNGLINTLKTGDNAPIAILMLLMLAGASFVGFGYLAERRRRRNEEE